MKFKFMQIMEAAPAIKEVKPINFLYFRAETYIHQLSNFVAVSKDLVREAVKHDLQITGPVQWHYFGFSGDGTRPFTLEIALPVSECVPDYDGSFHFKRTEPFKCVSLMHEGAWTTIAKSYDRLMAFIASENLELLSISREVYVNADLHDPDANLTEIQVGVK